MAAFEYRQAEEIRTGEPRMPFIRPLVVILASAFVLGDADAAGLIHTLPADGTGAVFAVDRVGSVAFDGEDLPVTSSGTMQVAVVGTQDVAGLRCRWIEIEVQEDASFGDERMTQFKWWKFLIPERELIDAQQGIAMALRIYSASDPDAAEPRLITGKEERRVLLPQIGTYFPPAPTDANRINVVVNSKTARTPAGDFECDCHVFDAYADRYLLGPSRIQESAIYRVWTSEECPLGVVAMEIQLTAQQVSAPLGGFAEDDYRLRSSTINMITRLKLQRVERHVVSRFPEHR